MVFDSGLWLGCQLPKHLKSVEEIKQEIVSHGPVVANMVAFQDLLEYSSGVYETEGDFNFMMGSHAVVIEGFGFEHDLEYWLVRNSWGSNWGEHQGHFRIRIGDSYIAQQGAYACETYVDYREEN